MLELVVKIVAGILLAFLGIYVLKKLFHINHKVLNIYNIILLLFLMIIPVILYKNKYSNNYTLITYLLAIVVYKRIFKKNIYETILATGILMILVFASDVFISGIALLFLKDTTALRGCWYVSLIANILVDLLVVLIISINKIQALFSEGIEKFSKNKHIHIILFILSIIISITIFVVNFNSIYSKNMSFLTNWATILLMVAITYIFMKEELNFNRLTDKYDALYQYVQTFETWVENEQLVRHEYKNQLAVIRALTKEKKVKEKIDSLVENTINVNNDMIESLKYVPNGGLKGLLYYKLALANKEKIKITIDVSKTVEKKLKKLQEEQIKDLSNLLGIYFDNAIEATKGLRKKIITLEIYDISDNVNFVITNSFNTKSIITNNTIKGISSKGKNRGNGLYFAKKLIDKNEYLWQERNIIDQFYIQKIIMKMPTKKGN